MKIKRTFETLVVTNRRYIVRQTPLDTQIACAKCGEPMLTAEQTAATFGITQRRIFQIIEMNAAHFTETEAGALMICLNSLAAVLDCESRKKSEETIEN